MRVTLPRVYLIINLLLLCSGYGYAAIPNLQHPNITRVSDRVFVLVGDMDVPNERNDGFISNSVFVITNSGIVVVDPGGSVQIGRMLLREIRKHSDKPITHVFNTHHHADHWMGNHAFSELTPAPVILGHATMRDTAREIGERWLDIIGSMTKGRNKGTKVVLPGELVSGSESYAIGGLTFALYHPEHAHTRGDIVIFIPEEKVLIAGDVLFYQRTPGFQDASPLGNRRALEEMMRFDAHYVIPGHGPLTDRAGLTWMIDYINLLHDQVQKFYAAGLQDFEMKDKIDVGIYHRMSGFEQRFGVNVNRMFLEVEAQEFQ